MGPAARDTPGAGSAGRRRTPAVGRRECRRPGPGLAGRRPASSRPRRRSACSTRPSAPIVVTEVCPRSRTTVVLPCVTRASTRAKILFRLSTVAVPREAVAAEAAGATVYTAPSALPSSTLPSVRRAIAVKSVFAASATLTCSVSRPPGGPSGSRPGQPDRRCRDRRRSARLRAPAGRSRAAVPARHRTRRRWQTPTVLSRGTAPPIGECHCRTQPPAGRPASGRTAPVGFCDGGGESAACAGSIVRGAEASGFDEHPATRASKINRPKKQH